jgi:hypothetical protein
MRPKIFIPQPIEESALKRLQTIAEVEVHPDATKNDRDRGSSPRDPGFNEKEATESP